MDIGVVYLCLKYGLFMTTIFDAMSAHDRETSILTHFCLGGRVGNRCSMLFLTAMVTDVV